MSHHAHVHDHHHHESDDSYYIDQLCMVALSGAFGVICLSMYLWQTRMLYLLLGQQFHPFVFASGIVLVLVACLRGYALWVQVGREKKAHAHTHHTHEHGHGNEQDAPSCAHDHHEHAPGEPCSHEHHHHEPGQTDVHHGHSHDHSHADHTHADHTHADHDHGWAPWRYVVLLVPILLFLLGIPNKLPRVQADSSNDFTSIAEAAGLVAARCEPWAQFGQALHYASDSSNEQAQSINFTTLESAANNSQSRDHWANQVITVSGQFAPTPNNSNTFRLVRFKISCCAADAVGLRVLIRCRESVSHIKADSWVNVRGRIQFVRQDNTYSTVLNVAAAKHVTPTDPDPRPYVQ